MDAQYPYERQPSVFTPYNQLTPAQQRARDQFLQDAFSMIAAGAAIAAGGYLVAKIVKAL